MRYTITVAGLRKSFGDRVVLDAIDLAVAPGEVFALLGPNGAGKSTLVRILATLLRPDAGTATVAGHDVATQPDAVRAAISLTGQHAAIDDVLTGEENLEMIGQLRGLGRRGARVRAGELLEEFDLLDARRRRAGTYSGGMKRRLDLAAGMVSRPSVMFLDEPTTGLDPRSREQLWSTVRRVVDDGVTVLVTTQYLEEADQLADRIAVLDVGRIAAEGTPDALKAGVGTELVRLRFADQETYRIALASLRESRGGTAGADEHLRTIEIATDGSAERLAQLLEDLRDAGAPAARASTKRPSLDDVFLALTSASPAGPPAAMSVQTLR